MRKHKGLTVEDHKRIATALRSVIRQLRPIYLEIMLAYGKTHRAANYFRKLDNVLGAMRSILDSEYVLDGHEGGSPYYGGVDSEG